MPKKYLYLSTNKPPTFIETTRFDSWVVLGHTKPVATDGAALRACTLFTLVKAAVGSDVAAGVATPTAFSFSHGTRRGTT